MAKNTYDFSGKLLDVDEQPIKEAGKNTDLTMSKLLVNILMTSTQNDPYKYFEMGLELKKSNTLVLDTEDKELLEGFIKNHQQLNVLTAGRLLTVLKNPKPGK